MIDFEWRNAFDWRRRRVRALKFEGRILMEVSGNGGLWLGLGFGWAFDFGYGKIGLALWAEPNNEILEWAETSPCV